MSKIVKWLLDSTGLKRQISAALSLLSSLVMTVPELAGFTVPLQHLAGLFGLVGTGQAVVAGSLGVTKLGSIVGVLASLIVILSYIPAAAPFLPMLQSLSAFLSAGSLASASASLAVHKSEVKSGSEVVVKTDEIKP